MEYKEKTKSQLKSENEELRKRIIDLEAAQRSNEYLERALLESEERYRSLYENAPLGYQSLDERGNFVDVNEAWCRSLGYQREDVIGMNFTGFLTMKSQEKFEKGFPELKKTGKVSDAEYEMIKKDGSYAIMSINGCAAYSSVGEFKQTHCILNDITEKRRAQEALRESEERLDLAIKGTGVGLWDWMVQTGEVVFNERLAEMLGYELKELKELSPISIETWNKLAHPDDLKRSNKLLKSHFEGNTEYYECEIRMKHKNGEWVWILDRGKVVEWDDKGKPKRMSGTQLDITDRKRAEEKLIESEEKYRSYFENDISGDFISTPEGKLIDCNKAFLDIFGFKSVAEAKSVNMETVYANTSARRKMISKIRKEKVLLNYEQEARKITGETIYINQNTVGEFDKNNRLILLRGNIIDITERKKSEEALLERDKKLQSIFRAAPVGIGLVSNRVLLDVNDRMCEMTGFSRNELIGKNARMLYPTKKDFEYVGREKYRQIKEKGTGTVETRWKHKDGKVVDILLSSTPLNPDDMKAGVTFTALDITERKRVEEEIRESEEKYRSYFENDISGDFISTPEGKLIDCNKAFLDIFGFKSVEEAKSVNMETVYANASARRKMISKIRKEKVLLNYEHKARKTTGEAIYISQNTVGELDKNNRLILLRGNIIDITKRKQAEEILSKSERRLKKAQELSKIGDYEWELKTNTVIWSDGLYNIFGFPIGSRITKEKLFKHIHPEDIEYNKKIMKKWLKEGGGKSYEYRIIRADGEVRNMYEECDVVYNEKGKVEKLFGVVCDITERKQTEDALRIERDNLNNIFKAMEDGVYIVNQQYDIQYVNPVLKKDFGVYEGRKCYEYFHDRKEVCSWCKNPEVFAEKTVRWEWYSFKNQRMYDLIDTPLKNLDGSISKLEIFRDITERKQAEEILLKSERRLKKAQELSKIGDYEWELKTNTVTWSDGLYNIFGFPTGSHITKEKLIKHIHPEDIEYNKEIMKKWLKEGGGEPYEYRIIRADGAVRNIYEECDIVYNEKGKVEKLFGVMHDITERKRAEEALRFTQFTVDHSQDAVFWLEPDAQFFYVNEMASRLLGYSKEELLKMSVHDISPDFPKETWKDHWRELKQRGSMVFESRCYTKDGRVLPIELALNILLYNGKEYNIASARDITGRKQAEEAILKERDRAQTYLNLAGVMFVAINTKGEVILINRMGCEVLGYQEKEIVGKNWFDNFIPERIKEVILSISKKLLSGEVGTAEYFENPVLTKKGEEKLIAWHNTYIKDQQGNIIGHLSSGEDITERKQAESRRDAALEAVKKAEEKYRSIFENAVEGIYQTTQDGKFISANPTLAKMLGYKSPEDLMENVINIEKQLYVESKHRDEFKKLINKQNIVRNYEIQLYHKDRKKIWVSLSSRAVRDSKGKIKYYEGTIEDITERKRADSELRKLSSAVGQSPASVIITDTKGNIEYVNPKFSQLTGYTLEEVLGKNPRILKSGETSKEEYKELWDTITAGGEWRGEFHNKKKNGELYWDSVIISPVLDEEGKISHFLSVKEDITEKKILEEKLKLSEELNREINENSPIGISVRSNTGQLLNYNQSWKNIWWKSEREIKKDKETKRKKLTFMKRDNYLGKWQAEVEKIFRKGGNLYIPELKTNSRKKDAARWISSYFYGIKDEKSKVDRVVILTEDITERKLAREKLRESESRLKILFESAPDAIFLINKKGNFNDGNNAATELVGYSRGELLKRKFTLIISRNDIPKATGIFAKTISGEPTGPEELEIIRKDNSKIIVEIRTFPVVIEDQQLVLGIARDITERKQVELEIRNSREQLRNLSGHLQTIREEERGTIAREIHDDLGQSLTALKMDACWLDKHLYRDRDKSRKKIQVMIDLVDETIQSVQRISTELRPGILDDLGLSSAIQWQSDEFEKRTGIRCKLHIKPQEIVLDENVSIAVFRIFQESLTNVVRHSKATKVNSSLTLLNSNLELIVNDNGVGIDENVLKDPKSLGLIGMQERVYPWKGKVEINGHKGKGTIVKVNISLKK